MGLLDAVLSWDTTHIQCAASSHRATDNPMRRDGQLGILCGVEYAAQAMALHGALATNLERVRVGYLASLRALVCHADRLDLLTGIVTVEAQHMQANADLAIYNFILRHEGRTVLEGRASVVLSNH